MSGQAAAHHLFVGAQDPVSDRVAAFRAQVGGTLDVAEQDRHRAVEETLAHPLPSHQGQQSGIPGQIALGHRMGVAD
jgi:hypothetical protein